jgi:hypothetical protein
LRLVERGASIYKKMVAYRFSVFFGFLVAVLAGSEDGDPPQPTVTMIGCSSKQETRCVLKEGDVATIVTEFIMRK